jgi:hypothetical protein
MSHDEETNMAFLLLLMIVVIILRNDIDCAPTSTILVFGIFLFIGKYAIDCYNKHENSENFSIISNEAVQNIGNALSNGTMTVNKQYCLTDGANTKCVAWDFFNKYGVRKQ